MFRRRRHPGAPLPTLARSLVSTGALALVLAGGLGLGGCAQKENERCELDSDCSGDLLCTRNVCLPRGSTGPTPLVEGGAPPDVQVYEPPLDGAVEVGAETAPESAAESAPEAVAEPSPDAGVDGPVAEPPRDGPAAG